MRYAPRGVVAVVAPWNFPIAIPMGMTAAGLATGNSVVLKPAEQSPGCGLMVVRALREAGVPPDALALVPGEGETGAALVNHPGVHTIAFTGSGPVGLKIIRAAAEPGPRHLKRVVAEMGGKNCVIVDSDADLDDVVPAIVSSAFVYAGQKCSAASRVLVHQSIADALLERIAGAVEVLVVGQADTFGVDVPPVIERDAQERVERYRDLARGAGRIAAERADGPPTFPPTPPSSTRRSSARCWPSSACPASTPPWTASRSCPSPSPAACSAATRTPSSAWCAAPPSATSTSTARSPARWSAASPSAATACRAPAPRPAAPTTCCTSSSRAWSPRTPCATAS
jgi:aldehyde dehydrogenase family protein